MLQKWNKNSIFLFMLWKYTINSVNVKEQWGRGD
jgi:hypothetical protein